MSDNRGMPSMDRIIDYWRQQDRPELEAIATEIGWGAPFCFGCGWMPPVVRDRKTSWKVAGGWLDRAHLHDRFDGGPDEPHNIVPLCHQCHDDMPEFGSYDGETAEEAKAAAWQWVTERPPVQPLFQVWTDMDMCLKNRVPSRLTVLKSKVRYLEFLIDVLGQKSQREDLERCYQQCGPGRRAGEPQQAAKVTA